MAQKKITDLTLRSDFDATVNLPGDDTSQTWRVTGQQILDFVKLQFPQKVSAMEIDNLVIVPSVNASALTIALKTKAGTDPSSTDSIQVGMRNSSLTSGSFNLRSITSALSMVVSSGSTLGQTDAQASRIWVYLIDNAGTLELAVSHSFYREDQLVSTTAEGGAGAADSATAIYSTTSRSSVPIRCIGYIDNTQTTAGTWASAGSQVQLMPQLNWKGVTVTNLTSGSSTYNTPVGCKMIIGIGAAAGGGGAGAGTNSSSGATAGGDTTFGGMTLKGGGFGQNNNSGAGGGVGGSGGTLSFIGILLSGGTGQGSSGAGVMGGQGGSNPLGGAGNGGFAGSANGGGGVANTGAGGGGAGPGVSGASGAGGGAGEWALFVIPNPASSYSYGIGAGGTAGTANQRDGGAGASGRLTLFEIY